MFRVLASATALALAGFSTAAAADMAFSKVRLTTVDGTELGVVTQKGAISQAAFALESAKLILP